MAMAVVDPKTVQRAVEALLKWNNSKSQKPQLLEEDESLLLNLTMKKIPAKNRINAYKIPLPHSLHAETSEICLFIDDRPKASPTKEEAMKKIKSEGIPVSNLINLSKLKSDYLPFEAKRKLFDSYDMFLADKRIVPLLPRLLGKKFYKKKEKLPVPVDLTHKNWKEQIRKACASAMLFLRTGTCCVVKVARLSMSEEEIVENVMAAINGIAEVVPSKWGNVRSFHLKLSESLALPVYQALPDTKLKIEGVKNEEEDGAKKVAKDEKVGKKKKKGRIHEVRYMDAKDEDEVKSDDDDTEGRDSENEQMSHGELGKKKRKTGDLTEDGVLGELNGEKRLKVKNKDDLKQKKDGGKKENGIKKKAGESGGKKEKKESKVRKLKSGETKLKAKKNKQSIE
ncbi:hypothetical protein UlMin_015035 [Ulmus minor]